MKPIQYCEYFQNIEPLCAQVPQAIGIEDASSQMSLMLDPPMDSQDAEFLAAFQSIFKARLARVSESLERILENAPSGTPRPTRNSSDEIAEAIFSVLTLGIFSATGCTPSSATRHPVISHGEMRFRWDLWGPASQGTLLFFRQVHFPSVEYVHQGKAKPHNVSFAEQYQQRILQTLQEYRPKHLFLEGLDEDLPPSRHSQWVAELRQKLNEAGVQVTEEMSEADKQNLELKLVAILGAGLVYGVLHPEVYLHRTSTADERKILDARIKAELKGFKGDVNLALRSTSMTHLILEQQENWATRELLDFFSKNTGEEAVLIFGALHQFCDDFARIGAKIRMASVWWDIPGHTITPEIPPACE